MTADNPYNLQRYEGFGKPPTDVLARGFMFSTRFDNVKYDDHAMALQKKCKEACLALESAINDIGTGGAGGAREKAIALTQLEHTYARCGRAIRDDQISRNGTAELMEGRGKE